MKKIILNLFLFFIVIFISLIVALSTIGIKTKKFNNLITNQINKFDNNIDLKLNVIKYKIDINQLSLFFQTKDPQFKFQNIQIPVKNIKVYVDFKSLFKQDLHIKKINLILGQIEIEKLKMLSKSFKPSNFNSFINNRVQKGMIDAEVEVYFDNKNLINNFITKGYVSNLNIAVNKNLSFKKSILIFLPIKRIFY